MEKTPWLEVVSRRLRSQILLENSGKFLTAGLLLAGLWTLAGALASLGAGRGEFFLTSFQPLFFACFYAALIFGFHLPAILQKGEKPLARLLGIRDDQALIVFSLTFAFISLFFWNLGHGLAAVTASTYNVPGFFKFILWTNDVILGIQAVTALLFFAGLFLFPGKTAKVVDKASRFRKPFLGIHTALLVCLALGYLQWVPPGTPEFFEQLRLAGMLWIALSCLLITMGRLMRYSALPALNRLESDLVSGRFESFEEVPVRFQTAFLSRRLLSWIADLSRNIASQTDRMVRCLHEALGLVDRENASEIDLNSVEDRYRKAQKLSRRLERSHQRFVLSAWFLDLDELSRKPLEALREHFSKELRNAKIELASVRKRIDEKLLSVKGRSVSAFQTALGSPEAPEQISAEV